MTTVARLVALADFQGNWRIERRIVHVTGPEATFAGQAEWVPEKDGLAYTEAGLLRMGAQPPMEARQSYFWDAALNVFFSDGRFFHQVPPGGGPTGHWCEPDQYDGVYDFSGWPGFTVTWRVKGPRKDYTMISTYTRA